MNRQALNSSHLASVGYDENQRMLEIEFTDGQVYAYADVPPEVYQALSNDWSPGTFFKNQIRNKYRFERV